MSHGVKAIHDPTGTGLKEPGWTAPVAVHEDALPGLPENDEKHPPLL